MSNNTASAQFTVLTLFPELFEPFASASLMGRAVRKGVVGFKTVQIRDFAQDKHNTVDDAPFGGGDGMVMRADVLHAAWTSVNDPAARADGSQRTVFLTPQGKVLDAPAAERLARTKHLILVCGHYEGVDERFVEECVDEEISIGDYVLTGGELPAMVLLDVISRFVPGVVGKAANVQEDSLQGGLLKYPQYTRPQEFLGRPVPEILLSGHHANIEKWRDQQRETRTRTRRPDLWLKRPKP